MISWSELHNGNVEMDFVTPGYLKQEAANKHPKRKQH